MSDAPSDDGTTDKPVYQNAWLRPYLQKIVDNGGSMEKGESDIAFAAVNTEVNPDGEWIGSSKVRQTLYITKFARQAGSTITITDEGRAFLEQVDAD